MESGDAETAGRAIIKEITISNYRSVGREVTLKLDPLTVLVGPNGSGKSNIVDALRFIADCMELGLGGAIDERDGIEACRRWNRSSGGQPYNVGFQIKLSLPRGPASYSLVLAGSAIEEYSIKSEEVVIGDGTDRVELKVQEGVVRVVPPGLAPNVDKQTLALPLVGGDARFKQLFTTLKSVAVYSIYPNTLRRPQKYSATKPMHRHGENWVSILRDQDQSTWKPDLVAALNRLTGDIDDVKTKRVAGFFVVQFRRTIKKDRSSAAKWFDAFQESDGTLRVAGIVTALLQNPPLPVIGIEEPELTVHPGALGLLYDFLVQASHRSQVVVTTHSPDLLDMVNDASAIRVVARDSERGTTIASLKESQRKQVREGLMTLGEVLRAEGLQQELPLQGDAEAVEVNASDDGD